MAAEYGLPVEFKTGRMEDLDLARRSFDLAVQNNSLCYIVARDDRRAALSKAARVLRPGRVPGRSGIRTAGTRVTSSRAYP